jgi:hypothetical protein
MQLDIARFTRLSQVVEGQVDPTSLHRLAPFLAAPGGDIHYRLAGSERLDPVAGAKKRVKCIIYGWFFLADPLTLEPVRHEIHIESRLVLVAEESELPPLEAEQDDEDHIVCGGKLDVLERVEEEILLDLPLTAAIHAVDGRQIGDSFERKEAAAAQQRQSPFAKLAELKKK